MKYFLFLLFQVGLCITFVNAQSQQELKIHADDILSPFSNLELPGITGSIIHKGQVKYLEAFGAEDLDKNKALSLNSRFNIGALSKQFTSLAFISLIEQGALSLDDNISDHLMWLPKYGHSIKVKHVLNHSTGLDDYNIRYAVQGGSLTDVLSQSDAVKLIASQKTLSYEPGTQFSIYFSDTEALLMAELIEQVSDTTFEAFTEKYVFERLELEETGFIREPLSRIDNLARTYNRSAGFAIARVNNRRIVGPSNLYTSAQDLTKWYTYFSTSIHSAENLWVQQLDQPVENESGQRYTSSWGEMTLGRSFLHLERGIPKYWQFGLIAGYGANVFRFPDEDLTSFAVGNNDQYNGYSAMMTIAPIIEDKYISPAVVDFSLIETVELPSSQLESYEGFYYNAQFGASREMTLRDDTLRYVRFGNEMALIPLSENVFQGKVSSDDVLIFTFEGAGDDRSYSISSGGSDPDEYDIYQPIVYKSNELDRYEGTYINEPLGQIYKLAVIDGELQVHHLKLDDFTLIPIVKDVFIAGSTNLGSWTFEERGGEIVSFKMSSMGLGGLTFDKINKLESASF